MLRQHYQRWFIVRQARDIKKLVRRYLFVLKLSYYISNLKSSSQTITEPNTDKSAQETIDGRLINESLPSDNLENTVSPFKVPVNMGMEGTKKLFYSVGKEEKFLRSLD